MTRLALFAFLACSASATVDAESIVGVASVIDADTIEIHSQRVRLSGVDAPESGQACTRDGVPWRCGQAAALALSDFVGQKAVRCDVRAFDRYKWAVATCIVDETDIGGWLVERGWALDWPQYSKGVYAIQQAAAERERRGIWASEFQPPWEWRRDRRDRL